MLVYKLCIEAGLDLTSFAKLPPVFKVMYLPGKTTRPNIGKLFAFDALDAAEWFGRNICNAVIWLAEAEGVERAPDYIVDPSETQSPLAYTRFWQNRVFPSGQCRSTPTGTVLCDSITPIRLVSRWLPKGRGWVRSDEE